MNHADESLDEDAPTTLFLRPIDPSADRKPARNDARRNAIDAAACLEVSRTRVQRRTCKPSTRPSDSHPLGRDWQGARQAGSAIDLAELAQLPSVVAELHARVETLEGRLALAERRPFTVAQAAQALGVSQKTIRRRVADGALKVVRTGSRIAIYLDDAAEDEISGVALRRS
jgi:excisionase family DNA binding protein